MLVTAVGAGLLIAKLAIFGAGREPKVEVRVLVLEVLAALEALEPKVEVRLVPNELKRLVPKVLGALVIPPPIRELKVERVPKDDGALTALALDALLLPAVLAELKEARGTLRRICERATALMLALKVLRASSRR